MKRYLALFLFAAAASIFASVAHAQVIIIANPGIKASEISKDELRDVFTGSTSNLKGGIRVTPVLIEAGATHQEFLQKYVGKSDATFRASWRNLLFSGQANMPKHFNSDADVVGFVSHTPNAIGYISKTTPHEAVKVLTVK